MVVVGGMWANTETSRSSARAGAATTMSIFERHDLLGETIGQRSEEKTSYENVQMLLTVVVPFFLIISILEPVVFLLYQYKVSPQANIVHMIILLFSFTP